MSNFNDSGDNDIAIDIDDNDVEVIAEFFNKSDRGRGRGNGGNFGNRGFRNNWRNQRYDDAFGDYRGGYGPGGGYGNFGGGNFGGGNFGGGNFGRGNFGRDNFGGGNFRGRNNQYNDDEPWELGFGPMMGPRMGPGMGPRMSPGFGPQFPRRGRGYGPGGPPRRSFYEDKALKYLKRCGVPNENLKGLPREFLELIDPEYCGVCGFDFESFAMSRIHYASKNHLKNQKKWLNQQSDVGYHGGRELPLKSRELYCELCDVHITSKSHAESHYAGRAHRSIVEGRKNPKNPMLLQSGMEDRVDQLIRREKRQLKALDEKVEAELAESGGEKVPPKPILPELYCEICKTSVTCSEQMTAHLNGKRHLTREKQHILKMMKGETNDNNQQEDDENEEEEGNENEEEEGNENEEEEGNENEEEEEQGDEETGDQAADSGEGNDEGTAKENAEGNNQENSKADDASDWGNGGDQW